MGVGYESLRVDEIRGLLQLVHDLHVLPPGGTGRRERMLAGLCAMVGASAGESAVVRVDGGAVRVLSSVRYGGRPGLMVRRVDGRDVVDPALCRLLRTRRWSANAVVTRTRGDLVGGREWYGSPFVGEVRRGLGADEAVYSARPIGAAAFAVICVAAADEPLDGRAVSVVQLLHSEAGWVYGEEDGGDGWGWGGGSGEGGGGPRVGIGLSPHMVHEHVKAAYRVKHVLTRAELMAPRGRRVRVGG